MLDEIEESEFIARSQIVRVYTVDGRWVFARLRRYSCVARVWMLEPSGDQGWTFVTDEFSDDPEYCWPEPRVEGLHKNWTYDEAEQAAYIFLTEGECEFDFHEGVALRLETNFARTWIDATISKRYDMHRRVTLYEQDGGWIALCHFEVWEPEIRCFEAENRGPVFPASGCGTFEDVRRAAYDWLVEPALNKFQELQAAA